MNCKVKGIAQIDVEIDQYEAFRLLLKTLDMEYVFNDTQFFVRRDEDDINGVYVMENKEYVKFDDDGDLFVALRNLAVNIFPNLEFRSADYIYEYEPKE